MRTFPVEVADASAGRCRKDVIINRALRASRRLSHDVIPARDYRGSTGLLYKVIGIQAWL